METVEPWLRGTLGEVDAVRRQVLHALQQAGEDLDRWCAGLSDTQVNARPCGLPPVAFQVRHIARSLGRLLSYMEGRALTPEQHDLLASEMTPDAKSLDVMAEGRQSLSAAMQAIHDMDTGIYQQLRGVGRKHLPTSVGGLMVHIAEHTQRHVGQAITTAKVVLATHPGAA